MAAITATQLEVHQRVALLNAPLPDAAITTKYTLMTEPGRSAGKWESLLNLTAEQAHARRREWNRSPLTDLFPRIPGAELERLLDICIAKNFTYDLSESRIWNARRYTAITVAHVRHQHSDYDGLLKEGVERFEARRQSGAKVWKVLREWCPWDSSNAVLERCFRATLLPLEQREADYAFVDDPMDIDSESDFGGEPVDDVADGFSHSAAVEFPDDPMEID